jgi:hypothetical protein
MHNVIMGVKGIDHANGNGLDNRRSNLRPFTGAQNHWNSGISRTNWSGHKGVGWNKAEGKWRARIQANGKRLFLGYFDTAEDAGHAYDAAARELHGEFARTATPAAGTPSYVPDQHGCSSW